MKERKAFTREERRLMIVQAFAIEIQSNREETMTIADIATKLNVTASTKLRIMVNEMVTEGLLVGKKQKHPGIAGFRVLYTLPIGDFHRLLDIGRKNSYKPTRSVRINSSQGSFLEVVND